MAPFSIDLPVREQEAAGLLPRESLDEQALRARIDTALERLAAAGHAGRARRHEDRIVALGEAMEILDQIVGSASLFRSGTRGRFLPRELLRVMQLLLHANLSGSDAPLRPAVDALKAVRNSWGLGHAAVDAS